MSLTEFRPRPGRVRDLIARAAQRFGSAVCLCFLLGWALFALRHREAFFAALGTAQ